MIIEFENCTLEIAHIGTPLEIVIEIVVQWAIELGQRIMQYLADVFQKVDEAFVSLAERWATC